MKEERNVEEKQQKEDRKMRIPDKYEGGKKEEKPTRIFNKI